MPSVVEAEVFVVEKFCWLTLAVDVVVVGEAEVRQMKYIAPTSPTTNKTPIMRVTLFFLADIGVIGAEVGGTMGTGSGVFGKPALGNDGYCGGRKAASCGIVCCCAIKLLRNILG